MQTSTLMRNNELSLELSAEDGLGRSLFIYLWPLHRTRMPTGLAFPSDMCMPASTIHRRQITISSFHLSVPPPHRANIITETKTESHSSFYLSAAHRACFPQRMRIVPPTPPTTGLASRPLSTALLRAPRLSAPWMRPSTQPKLHPCTWVS